MKILELRAENFKKLRVVEIRPDGNLVAITGRNGQGKTSVLDSIWFALKGKKAMPLKPVRKGSERMKVSLETEDFTVIRTMNSDGVAPSITLEMKRGKQREGTPQDFLDNILGELTFDPLEFLNMDTQAQVTALRKTAKIDVDFEEIAKLNDEDYKTRLIVNRELKSLDEQVKASDVIEGLPKEKIDEAAIMAKLNNAGTANHEQLELTRRKDSLRNVAAACKVTLDTQEQLIARLSQQIEDLTAQAKAASAEKIAIETKHKKAVKDWQSAPEGQTIDVTALTVELQSAQRTNRAIDARSKYDELKKARDGKQRESEKLTRQMEGREEKKRAAIAGAKIPVEGITFDDKRVLFNGLPLENLGEGEQIRISTQIGMAANPKLRVLCIRHGEALDEDGMKVIAELAKANDFQVWMARVDTTGKVGIVLEDGMVQGSEEA